ncbi:MAG: J domain-containing protein [Deltaproteobacteria bacterium]|nr:MAG: J domain-containing protein [Deltaproteobacteria bacterium]
MLFLTPPADECIILPMSQGKVRHRDIVKAAEILGLGESATIEEIKSSYHRLARLYHPDSGNQKASAEKFMEVAWAYQTLMSYVSSYRVDFSLEAYVKNFPEERLRRRFFSDPLWGPGKIDEDEV